MKEDNKKKNIKKINNDKNKNKIKDKEKKKIIKEKNKKKEVRVRVKVKKDIKDKENKKKKISKQSKIIITILIISLLIAIALFVNLVLREDNVFNIDTTAAKMFKLTKNSKEIVKNIDEPIEITVNSKLQFAQITELLNEITKLNNLITITKSEPAEDEEQEQMFYATIIVTATDRERAHSVFDLNFDTSLINEKNFKQYSLLEEKLINAMIAVTKGESPEEPSVAFLTGLEGSELEEELGNLYAELIFYGIQSVKLDLKKFDIPKSINTIAIIGPMKDINKTEYNKLIEFQARGGNFVIAATYVKDNSHPILDQFLSSYGVKIPAGAVLEYQDGYRHSVMQQIEVIQHYNNILLPIPTSDNEITKDMDFEGSAPFFIFPTKINFDSDKKLKEKNVKHINHIITSDKAVFKTGDIEESDVTSENLPPDAVTDIFVLGTIAEKKMAEDVRSTAVIYSNYLFMTDLIIQGLVEDEIILQKDNLKLAKNSFIYLNPLKEEKVNIKKALVISPYKYDKNKIVLHKALTYLFFIIPMVLVAIFGGLMLYKRGYFMKYGLNKKDKNNKNQ